VEVQEEKGFCDGTITQQEKSCDLGCKWL